MFLYFDVIIKINCLPTVLTQCEDAVQADWLRVSTFPQLLEITVKLLEITSLKQKRAGWLENIASCVSQPDQIVILSIMRKIINVIICSFLYKIAICYTTYDQRQTGDLNIQVEVKDIQLFAFMKGNKEEYVVSICIRSLFH